MKNLITLVLLSIGSNYLYCQDIAKTKHDKKSGQDAESYTSFTFDGAWCWFSDPRAVYYEGQYKRTYAGWIDRYGDVHIGYYDHGTGHIDSRVIYDGLQVNDHDSPSILFDEEGRLLVFYSKHGDRHPLILSRSVDPENIYRWHEPSFLHLNDTVRYKDWSNTYTLRYRPWYNTYTYSNPVKLSSEGGRIYLFWRGVDYKPNYAWSDDNAKTWSKGGIFILPERIYQMRRPYLKISSNGVDRIHFAFTDGHPRKESENSIYYMYCKGGELFKANGEKIGKLGDEITPRMTDCVYDAVPTLQKSWVWDVAASEDGSPVIVYAKFQDDSNHIYCHAAWDGASWQITDLVNSGAWFPKTIQGENEREPNYSGGIVLDHENPEDIYLSVKRDSVFEIEKWTRQKNGRSWTVSKVTKGSLKDNVRPVTVRGATGENPLQLLWMCNTNYVHYTNFQASIQMNLPLFGISDEINPEGILDVMHRVADWQIMNPREPYPLDWHYGAFYTGLWAMYKTTGEERYKNEIKNLGQRFSWKIMNDIYHADRLTIAQTYADLYMEEKDSDMLEKIRWVMDMHVDRIPNADLRFAGNPYFLEWWTWCDALYMAPPAFARVYAATGDESYLNYLDEHWWKTSDYLYSKKDSLYYRDDRFFDQRSENGKKIFWGRGNGWVIAGLARTLDHIPEEYRNRGKFINQFKEMAAKLLSIQQEDGLWRASLLDTEYLDIGESSGSSFFTYALAWGINNEILDETLYRPAVIKAWKALVHNVNEQGRLGYVQQVAGSPYPFYFDQSHVYASGAFLLAGSEILKMHI